jgi:hypothetical protein
VIGDGAVVGAGCELLHGARVAKCRVTGQRNPILCTEPKPAWGEPSYSSTGSASSTANRR